MTWNKVTGIVLAIIVLANAAAFAEDGTIVYQTGNTMVVFPWRTCLLVSAGLSVGLWFLRSGSSNKR